MRGFFSGEGLILLRASGNGDLFFNSYGAIIELDVEDEVYVDTGFIVAFESTLNYNVTALPGSRPGTNWKSLFLGGEGLFVDSLVEERCGFKPVRLRPISTGSIRIAPFRRTTVSVCDNIT